LTSLTREPAAIRTAFGLLPVGMIVIVAVASAAVSSAKVNPPGNENMPPSGVVTSTSTQPFADAGVIAVTVVASTTVTAVAAAAPNMTVVPAAKPLPVIVTGVPPAVAP
jgi:hypothetical protein